MPPRRRWQDPEGRKTLRSIEDLVAPILDGDDILCCTATGDGKSAAFSVPILALQEYHNNRNLYPVDLPTRIHPVGIVVTPTKGLASNIVLELTKLGISAFAYCAETLALARRNDVNLTTLVKECTRWQVICVDPEHLCGKEWLEISEWPIFRARILFVVIDEVHLINEWGATFRLPFAKIGLFVRGRLPRATISIVGLSASLAPGKDTNSVCASLGFFGNSFHLIRRRRSNERPNVQFIMQPLTHGLSGYDFPDFLPYLTSGRKTSIHCDTLDLVFRVYVYIWRLQASGTGKMWRTRMYTRLCSDEKNTETIRLIDEDPHCQIIIATIAFSNGINAKNILDSISLGCSSTLDMLIQEKGRAGRASGSRARGVVLVQPATIAAAKKQLQIQASAATPPAPTAAKKSPPKKKQKKPSAPMSPEKALILTELTCLNAFTNGHYSNPPLETSTLDCIAARRLLPCSLCCARAGLSFAFSAPPSSPQLAPLVPPLAPNLSKSRSTRKSKLSAKEKESATTKLTEVRDEIRAEEQLSGNFRNLPPVLFLPSSIRNNILDKLLTIESETDRPPLVASWSFRHHYTDRLYERISSIQTTVNAARKEKSKATKKATTKRKRKRTTASEDDEDDYKPTTDTTAPLRHSTRPHKRLQLDKHANDSDDSDSFPEAILPPPAPRRNAARSPLKAVTNKPKPKQQTAADISKDFRPAYRPRNRT
ncbi:P-loop containing nucleoside triphosphate hydrolase protein [Mycena filopes]|nr:P-loop containing nucleoside triphosphate hydrolase protein [Mycena filopes]